MEKRASIFDRRSGKDRRKGYRVGRFFYRGAERRRRKEQRSGVERRLEWVRISRWSSVFVSELKIAKFLTG